MAAHQIAFGNFRTLGEMPKLIHTKIGGDEYGI